MELSRPAGRTTNDAARGNDMIRLWSIAKNTFLQTIRQPIFGVLVLATLSVVMLGFLLPGWSMSTKGKHQETDQQMMESQGLGTLLISGLLIASFSAAAAVSREIDDRTAQTVICKPVPRVTFVLGKFAGVAGAASLAFYLALLLFLMTVRHRTVTNASDVLDWPVLTLGVGAILATLILAGVGNLVFGWTFISTLIWVGAAALTLAGVAVAMIGKDWHQVHFGEGLIRPALLSSVLLVYLEVQFLVAVAVAVSTRLSQALTLLVCFSVYVTGVMHPFFFGPEADPEPLARLAGLLLPNLTYFDPQNMLLADEPMTGALLALTSAYWLALTVAALGIGAALFETRQLESQTASVGMPPLVGMLAWAGRAVALVASVVALRLLAGLIRQPSLSASAMGLGTLAGAAAGWVFWRAFARGKRWAYWLALPGAGLLLAGLALAQFAQAWQEPLAQIGLNADLALVALVIMAAVGLVLVLPGTRRHFSSVNH
ncbi:MAG: ABC transporter permease subunit [Planctomycetota bacterium]|nr:ABC transporter permease subunit [Planctomycetota bacterium]